MLIVSDYKYRNKKILAHARGQECQMRLPGTCNRDPSTVVAAHSNAMIDGKGAGTKAHDIFTAFLCSACHDAYDRRTDTGRSKEYLQYCFDRAMKNTLLILLRDGILR